MISFNLPLAPIKDPSSINVFLLTGEPLTLVDTGIRTEAAWESLNLQLAEHSYNMGDIQQVVLTHAHPDHYGLAARIADHAEVEILAHRDAAPRFLYDKPDWERGNHFLLETLTQRLLLSG